jgi:3-methyl-2-oxobutanoate hydroxymethyltransferase
MKRDREKFTVLTAYDASFAALAGSGGRGRLLVGDSLGMVVQGQHTTVPVTLEDMIYHTRLVARGCRTALLMADMPFASYATVDQSVRNAARLMQEGGAHIVKLEGGARLAETVRQLSRNGIPVCAHLGLLPQSVHKLGGYKVQGREEAAARQIIDEALAVAGGRR